MRNPQRIQEADKAVLRIKAYVDKPALFLRPLGKTTIIKEFLTVFDDKRNDVVSKAFLQSDNCLKQLRDAQSALFPIGERPRR